MITIADLKQHLDDSALHDMWERLDFEPVSLAVADDVDYWGPDNGDTDRIRIKALVWGNA